MILKFRGKAVVFVVALMFLAGVSLFAHSKGDEGGCQGKGDGPECREKWGGPHGDGIGWMLEKLDLSADQQKKMRDNKEVHEKLVKGLLEKLKGKRTELQKELDKPASDTKAINAITSDIKNVSGQLVDDRTKAILDIKAILTPEQFGKLSKMMEGRGENGGKCEMREHRRHHDKCCCCCGGFKDEKKECDKDKDCDDDDDDCGSKSPAQENKK